MQQTNLPVQTALCSLIMLSCLIQLNMNDAADLYVLSVMSPVLEDF